MESILESCAVCKHTEHGLKCKECECSFFTLDGTSACDVVQRLRKIAERNVLASYDRQALLTASNIIEKLLEYEQPKIQQSSAS